MTAYISTEIGKIHIVDESKKIRFGFVTKCNRDISTFNAQRYSHDIKDFDMVEKCKQCFKNEASND